VCLLWCCVRPVTRWRRTTPQENTETQTPFGDAPFRCRLPGGVQRPENLLTIVRWDFSTSLFGLPRNLHQNSSNRALAHPARKGHHVRLPQHRP
jgi:hypothetical protein